jgi:glycosyltransferase involved in cell wall biosynthesis
MASTQKENVPTEKWIALLGRKDVPADGIADYCGYLGQNLAKHDIELEVVRVEWVERGWLGALAELTRRSKGWPGIWVLPQYTAMGWSNRGFPIGALACAAILRLRGVRCGTVFHEPWGITGPGLIDRIRGAFQNVTVRTLHLLGEKSVFTIPLHTVPWLSKGDTKSAFIPLGSNIPESATNRSATRVKNNEPSTVAVFCLSESPYGEREVNDIASAMRVAASGGTKMRVVFVGRGTPEARKTIEQAFAGSGIEVCNHGLRDATEVARLLSEADVMIAVRGRLYLRRGSALAGVACGLPIVGYSGAATGTLIEEAGITLVPFGDHQALGMAVRDIVTNAELWQEMHEKNLSIQKRYLSWNVIAMDFVSHLSR